MKVELIDVMGSDLTVVNAARVSFDKESDWERQHWDPITHKEDVGLRELSDKDKKLIKFLARENHFTPFTHCVITLRETVPIFVARQRFKHTVGFTYNEVSRRYVSEAAEFYIPDEWRGKPKNSKQGSDGVIHPDDMKLVSDEYQEAVDICVEIYNLMLSKGVAPEQARMVLPQSMYTSYYTTGSLSAFARAYKLRSDSHSQKEIQELAISWDQIIRPLFPCAWSALVDE